MLKLFFYNRDDQLSQQTLYALKQAGANFKEIEVTSKALASRIKRIGISQVPTLYLRDNRSVKMLVGSEILNFLEPEDEFDEESYEVPKEPIKKVAKKSKVAVSKEASGSDVES